MQIKIKTLSHPPLQFFKHLPQNFGGAILQGGEILSAEGRFGQICIQEYHCEDFTVRYSVIETGERFHIETSSAHSGLHSLIMMRNTINLADSNDQEVTIKERQFTLINGHRPKSNIEFSANQHYISFETMFSQKLTQSVAKDFPNIEEDLNIPAHAENYVWLNPAKWTDDELMDQIYYLLGYRYAENYRHSYFYRRVKEICWKLLFILGENPVYESTHEVAIADKARYVMRLIMENLDEHLLIKELAQKAGINESQLKKSFKKVYGMGIHEYRIYERLKVAMRLLKNGSTVNEAALETGWRPADLIKAFYKTYGTTPGTIRKKGNS